MADENIGGGNPGGSNNEQPGGGGGNPNPGGNAPGGGQQPVANTGGNGGQGEKTYSFKEDRSDWLPRTRFNDVNGKLTAAEKEREQLRQELETERRRVQALSGVNPPDPKAKETEELRSAMYELFPQLKSLEKLSIEQLQEVFEAANTASSTAKATWERHAEDMLTGLETEAADKLGIDKLSPKQSRGLRRAYREEAMLCMEERKRAQESGDTSYDIRNDFISRHERGDRTLLKEFAKSFLDDWYEPAVRSVTARQSQRMTRPVPRGDRTRTPAATRPVEGDLTKDTDFKKALLAARGNAE